MLFRLGWSVVLSVWDYLDDVNGNEKEDPATVGGTILLAGYSGL